jgi:hypothetical protein
LDLCAGQIETEDGLLQLLPFGLFTGRIKPTMAVIDWAVLELEDGFDEARGKK